MRKVVCLFFVCLLCLFVCLFVCLFACCVFLFVCLFACCVFLKLRVPLLARSCGLNHSVHGGMECYYSNLKMGGITFESTYLAGNTGIYQDFKVHWSQKVFKRSFVYITRNNSVCEFGSCSTIPCSLMVNPWPAKSYYLYFTLCFSMDRVLMKKLK